VASIEVGAEEIITLCVKGLRAEGLTTEEARIVAKDYVETEAAGRPSHGLAGFDVALNDARNRGRSETARETAALIHVQGNRDLGHLVVAGHFSALVEKARTCGIALLAASDVSRLASPGTFCRRGAEMGLASICFEYGGGAFVAALGNVKPSISTNPIAIGFPGPDGTPICLDMATSGRALFFVKLAERLGQPIPAGWAVDESGEDTTDPARATSLSPVGGYKGFGLGFMLELLTGPMLGVAAGRQGKLASRGLMGLLIDPISFGVSSADLEEAVGSLIADLDGARYPGEESGTRLSKVKKTGRFKIEETTYQRLINLVNDAVSAQSPNAF
jgi:LDH2 family malate/lactate/ureidoglycolate dehydrogenase